MRYIHEGELSLMLPRAEPYLTAKDWTELHALKPADCIGSQFATVFAQWRRSASGMRPRRLAVQWWAGSIRRRWSFLSGG